MTVVINGTTGISGVDGSAGTPAVKGTDTDTGVVFGTNTLSLATNGTTALTVDTSQNVGIGTSSPGYKVEMAITSGSNFYSATTSAVGQDVGYRLASTATSGREYRISTSDPTRGSYGAGLAFVDATAGAARMLIDSSGNLLINTTSTNSNEKVRIKNANDSRAIAFQSASAAECGYIYINAGGTGTTYSTSSDYRLKENIAPMTGALAKVVALKPVTYKWKVNGSDGQGFIAHELQSVVPDCVVGEKDAVDADGNPQYQGIDTSFLVATLTAAIQEQQALITALTARITALEAK
jgi:hypothetical protein